MTDLYFSDDCTADAERKPKPQVITRQSGDLMVKGDSIWIGDEVIAYRIEPIGFGDVHWQIEGTPYLYTRIEVLP